MSYQDIAWHWFIRSGHPDLYMQYKSPNLNAGETGAQNEGADAHAYSQAGAGNLKLMGLPRIVVEAHARA